MSDVKEKAAFNSVLASAGLAAGKFVAAFMTGSLGLLSDALHALLDVGATLMTYFAVRISSKPADDKHHYGHGKIEAVAALIETGLLFVVAAYVSIEAIGRLRHGTHELTPSVVAYVVLGVSILVDIVRSRSLLRIAKETKSEALAADALHFGSDLVSSSLVLAGLAAAQLGYPQGDTFSAIGVAIFIGIAGYRLGKRTIDTLMDAVPEGLSTKIRALAANAGGVVSVDTVRVRATGQEIFADIGIGVARTSLSTGLRPSKGMSRPPFAGNFRMRLSPSPPPPKLSIAKPSSRGCCMPPPPCAAQCTTSRCSTSMSVCR